MTQEKKLSVVVPAYNEEKSLNATLIGLYSQTLRKDVDHILVNNLSSDHTRKVAETFQKDHPDFPLIIIEEPQKGTGAAADTGFRYAMDNGATLIARMDADSVPRTHWTQAIIDASSREKAAHLFTGPIHVRKDDGNYRRGDQAMVKIGTAIARLGRSVAHRSPADLRIPAGANLTTTASAYRELGGFKRSTIEELDEDVDYAYRLHDHYGFPAMIYDKHIEVDTSARRMRHLGYIGTLAYYLNPPERRDKKSIDVR